MLTDDQRKERPFYRVCLALDDAEGILTDVGILRRVGNKPSVRQLRSVGVIDRFNFRISGILRSLPPNRADRQQQVAVHRAAGRLVGVRCRKRKHPSRHQGQLRSLSNAVRHR